MQGAAPGSVPGYVPGPVEVGWEVYVGAAACVAVFALGAWEFVKRIVSCLPRLRLLDVSCPTQSGVPVET